jgi:hypothetical protein
MAAERGQRTEQRTLAYAHRGQHGNGKSSWMWMWQVRPSAAFTHNGQRVSNFPACP